MKHARLLLVVFFAALLMLAVTNGAYADNKSTTSSSDFQSSYLWNRVSPGLQQAWQNYQKTGSSSDQLDCFVIMRAGADEGDKDLLLDAGFAVQVAAGLAWKGHMNIKDLPRVAAEGMVKQIKLTSE